MMKLLENKKIVIMGGTTGMGLSAAKAFIAQGALVVVVGRSKENVAAALEQLGSNAVAVCGDAMQPDTSENAIECCVSQWNGFDGLYHVAGGSGRKFGDGPLHELTLDGWNKTFEMNTTSMMLANRAAVKKLMQTETEGSILNLGSVLGASPSPHYFATHAYAAAKSAAIGFSKSVAAYYASKNIRVNMLVPALVETPMSKRAMENEGIMSFIKTKQPLDGGRIGQPEDLDGLAIYFMGDQSKFTTGQVITVDGGWSISDGQY
jgi:NAD(P)-dependent dehydrogenase (short-subunit alcohol dehydrogenase family)